MQHPNCCSASHLGRVTAVWSCGQLGCHLERREDHCRPRLLKLAITHLENRKDLHALWGLGSKRACHRMPMLLRGLTTRARSLWLFGRKPPLHRWRCTAWETALNGWSGLAAHAGSTGLQQSACSHPAAVVPSTAALSESRPAASSKPMHIADQRLYAPGLRHSVGCLRTRPCCCGCVLPVLHGLVFGRVDCRLPGARNRWLGALAIVVLV